MFIRQVASLKRYVGGLTLQVFTLCSWSFQWHSCGMGMKVLFAEVTGALCGGVVTNKTGLGLGTSRQRRMFAECPVFSDIRI